MTASLLGIEASARQQAWRLRVDDHQAIDALKTRAGLDELTARLLAGRGILAEDAESFLNPTLRTSMTDPSTLRDMDKAAALIWDALEAQKSITVFADYDVDGGTSAAQLIRWARAFGADFGLYVPDRVREGYGPSAGAFETLKSEGVDLVITVDCGAAATSALVSAQELDMPVIVIDHHLMEEGQMPPSAALVNPNRPDDSSGLGHLAAAGVTFYLLAALNREARKRGHTALPDLKDMLGLAALGTICDVVPLTGVNRAITAQGLKMLGKGNIAGIQALAAAANISPPFTTYHAGFVIGPRINAGGRIGQADMGARLLSTDNAGQAQDFAAELDRVNGERKRMQDTMIHEATERFLKLYGEGGDAVVIADMQGWHPGIIGIIAGRLKDRLRVPVIVIGIDEAGIGKGSGRSISGVNLGAAISAAKNAGLLASGGGHAMAGGLTLEAGKIAAFRTFMEKYLADDIKAARAKMALNIDALIHPAAVGDELLSAIASAGPYGAGNPEPVFAFADLRLAFAQRVRGGHVRVSFEAADGTPLRGICFRADETGLSDILLDSDTPRLHAAGRIKEGSWQGRRQIDFHLIDIAKA